MNLSQMREEVQLIVQDAGFTEDAVDNYINQALQFACTKVAIPSLKVVGSVDTVVGQRYCNLTTASGGFSGRLNAVFNSTKETQCNFFPDLDSLLVSYPTEETGSVQYVALEGDILWYHPVPEEVESLTVLYYTNPVALAEDTDVPTELPSALHRKLLVHGACYMIFDMIEDGIEGEKVNTLSHFYHSFNDGPGRGVKSGIQDLHEFVGGRRRNFQSSVWRV